MGAGITICAALVLLIIICSIPEEFRPLTFLFVVWNLIALSALFRYVKEQFANPRAHLMPEFRRVHATVGIVAMLIVAAVIPAIWIPSAGHGVFGAIAITTFLAGTVLWSEMRSTRWLSWVLPWLFFAAVVAGGMKQMEGCLDRLVSGELKFQAALLLVAVRAATVLGMMRLFRLNEEMPEYHYRPPRRIDAGDQQVADEPITPTRFQNWLADQRSECMIRHARRASTSWWSRAQRWQVGMISGWSALLWSFGLCAACQFFAWRGGGNGWTPIDAKSFLYTYIAIFVSVFSLPQRMPTMQYELLLSVDGVGYFKQVGGAFAISHLRLWSSMSLVLLFWWSVTAWEPSQLGTIAGVLFVSACFQIWTMAVLVCWQRCRSLLLAIPLIVAFMLPWAFVVGWLNGPNEMPVGLLLSAAIFGILGVMPIWHAYHHLAAADID